LSGAMAIEQGKVVGDNIKDQTKHIIEEFKKTLEQMVYLCFLFLLYVLFIFFFREVTWLL
jgi:hypothetical protein